MSAARLGPAVLVLAILLGAGPLLAEHHLTCDLCTATIEGEYAIYEDLGWNVCSQCSRAPRCVGCQLPRAGRLEGEAEHCSRCLSLADGCTACGRPIVARYWTVSGVPGKFCDRCRDESPECSSCRAPARDGRLVAGRLFCQSCRPKLVVDVDVYDSLFRQVAERAENHLGLALKELPQLVISSPDEIALQRGDQARNDSVCGLFLRDEKGRPTIHLLSHQTQSRTAAVLAHEYAHAWQSENCPENQGLRLREGFAEWVAWKVLEGMEDAEGERSVIAARLDDYGLGFRIFSGVEARHGTDHAIWYAKAARQD